MIITLTPEQEAFIKAHYDTDDIVSVIEEHLGVWVNDMVDAVYQPPTDNTARMQRIQQAAEFVTSERVRKSARRGGTI